MGDVRVLVLVHQDVAEPALIVGQHVRVLLEKFQAQQQQVTEIDGVQRPQPLLVGAVKRHQAAIRRLRAFGGRNILRRQAPILPALDRGHQHPGRPAARIEPGRLDHLLQQALLVVGIQDGEAVFQTNGLRVPPQDADANRMERAEPHGLCNVTRQRRHPLPHLSRGLVGEGHGQDLARPGAVQVQDMRKPCGQYARLAGAGPCQHQHGTVQRLHGVALRTV